MPRQLWENQTIAELARVAGTPATRPIPSVIAAATRRAAERAVRAHGAAGCIRHVEQSTGLRLARGTGRCAGLRHDGAAIVTEAQLERAL